jgi:phosphoribosylformylglycinamidine (FGAM) synthase-like amidotransferase family enzyme
LLDCLSIWPYVSDTEYKLVVQSSNSAITSKMKTSVLNIIVMGFEGHFAFYERKEQSFCTDKCVSISLAQVNVYVTINEYNNPSFATMFQRALLNTCITTCSDLNPSHHQVL